jgi:hypothetical protein
MKNMSKNTNIDEVGNSLIEHVRDAAVTRPGIVEEIFPHIVQASKKISARAIAKFLEEKHGVKVSYVTIGRALRNPQKYWNLYYNSIEQSAWTVAETHGKPLKHFMSEPEMYQEMLDGEKVYQADNQDEIQRAVADYENAVALLDAKWFCFDDVILEEARKYLLPRFVQKPVLENDETE